MRGAGLGARLPVGEFDAGMDQALLCEQLGWLEGILDPRKTARRCNWCVEPASNGIGPTGRR